MAQYGPHTGQAFDRFRRWVREHNLTHGAVAGLLECDQSTAHRVFHGVRAPSRKVANAIERATAKWSGGPIRASEWDAETVATRKPTAA